MFNLLPISEKKKIFQEYRLRLITIGLFFVFILGLIATMFLIPSYLISSARDQEITQRVDAVRRSTILNEADELNSRLVETNLKIQALSPGPDQAQMSDVLGKIIDIKRASIRINSIDFRKRDSGGNEIVISGVASDRENLSGFVKDLEDQDIFTEINIPVSSFARDRNATFSIEIKGNF